MNSDRSGIGKWLLAAVEARGLTLSDVAQRSGIHPSQLSFYANDRRMPSVSNLVQIADAIGCSLDELLGRAGPGRADDSDWSGPDGQPADRPIHVVPNNDLREHDLDHAGLCPCMPMLVPPVPAVVDGVLCQPDNSQAIWRHNSYDGREVGEVCRTALDALGSALADHSHEWSAEQRQAYEHAIHLLDMHWPKVTG